MIELNAGSRRDHGSELAPEMIGYHQRQHRSQLLAMPLELRIGEGPEALDVPASPSRQLFEHYLVQLAEMGRVLLAQSG